MNVHGEGMSLLFNTNAPSAIIGNAPVCLRYKDRNSSEKPFPCDYPDCKASYHNKHSLRRHQTQVHGRAKRRWRQDTETSSAWSDSYLQGDNDGIMEKDQEETVLDSEITQEQENDSVTEF